MSQEPNNHSQPEKPVTTRHLFRSSFMVSVMTQISRVLGMARDIVLANAIGAAVALNTIEITLHVDTKRRLLVIPELGINEKNATIHHGQETVDLAFQYVKREAQRLGLSDVQEPELISVEDFPVVEGWHSMERLITVKVQLKAGVSTYVS